MPKVTLREQVEKLQEENEKLRIQNQELYMQITKNYDAADGAFLASPAYKQYREENETLKELLKTLEKRVTASDQRINELLDLLEQRPVPEHNARGAGRKKADEKWQERYRQWVDLHKSQKSIKETCEEMSISRATYYRYQRQYKANM